MHPSYAVPALREKRTSPWISDWFRIIECHAIDRGGLGSVKDLNAKIRAFIDGWNDRWDPFKWTKTADELRIKANRKNTSNGAY